MVFKFDVSGGPEPAGGVRCVGVIGSVTTPLGFLCFFLKGPIEANEDRAVLESISVQRAIQSEANTPIGDKTACSFITETDERMANQTHCQTTEKNFYLHMVSSRRSVTIISANSKD